MRVHFHGAAGTVTGSMHLLEVGKKKILLDCGLYQGRRKEAFERNRNLPFDAASVDCCILSHAHIDHSGNLPSLVGSGFRGPIHSTPATADLCSFMLKDSAYLQARDVLHVNKKRKERGQKPFELLYDGEDVERCLKRFETHDYEESFEVCKGVRCTLVDAGHILGSAAVILDIDHEGESRRLVFTGDIGRSGAPILADPVPIHDVDYLITEGTYGNRLHPQAGDIKTTLLELCTKVIERRSRLLIPAFAVGRTQQILYFLNELYGEGKLAPIPVFVDSPMAARASETYELHDDIYDAATTATLLSGDYPFAFPKLKFTQSVEESKRINELDGPMIVIAASGMCEGGRVLHHLKNGLGQPKNIVLFPGYQAQHTLGRRIVEGREVVRILGGEYPVRAEIVSVRGLSAHADSEGLLEYIGHMGDGIRQAFVVHCEPEAGDALAEALRQRGLGRVHVPVAHEAFMLDG